MTGRGVRRIVRGGARGRRRVSTAALTAFGDSLPNGEGADPASEPFAVPSTFFTGKPHVAGLGWAFLFRSYRADLAKWQTADPLGYPDG